MWQHTLSNRENRLRAVLYRKRFAAGVMKGWNYMVRLYRPSPEALNDQWKLPRSQAGPIKTDLHHY